MEKLPSSEESSMGLCGLLRSGFTLSGQLTGALNSHCWDTRSSKAFFA